MDRDGYHLYALNGAGEVVDDGRYNAEDEVAAWLAYGWFCGRHRGCYVVLYDMRAATILATQGEEPRVLAAV